jgi:uncharacterized protein DUF1565
MRSTSRAAVVSVIFLVACEDSVELDATSTTSASSTSVGGSGGGAQGCPDLYVSPDGDDAETGCDPMAPKRTIGSALDAARASTIVAAIHVCAGTYDEALLLDVPVDLLGGYACASWSQTTAYGYPTFDAANDTRIGGSRLPEALRVTGSAVTSATRIDGFTIVGADSGDEGVALHVTENAAPEIANCRILGGATESTGADGSVGLLVTAGATPEVHHDLVDGGRGITFGSGGVGRAGIVVESAGPSLHDNRITGGAATPGGQGDVIPSAGVVLRNTLPLTVEAGRPIASNTLEGGDGNGKTDGIASVGVLVLGAGDVDLVGDVVRPGHSLGVAKELRGVHAQSTGAVRILGSRIYGGDVSNPAAPWQGFRVGVWVVGAQSLLVENTMIYGGVAEVGFDAGSPSFALALDNVQGAIIRHNTLYSGPSGFPTVGTALKAYANVTGTIVQNNILAADGGWNEPVYVEECASQGVFQAFQSNLLLDTNDPSKAPDSLDHMLGYGADPQRSCQPWQGFDTVDALASHLTAAGVASHDGNLTLRADCGGDTGCIPWAGCDSTTSLDCLSSVFEGWSAADNGLATLLDPGWKLAPGVPCAVAKSGLDLTASVASDSFGTARTAPPSMGAHELDGPCQP